MDGNVKKAYGAPQAASNMPYIQQLVTKPQAQLQRMVPNMAYIQQLRAQAPNFSMPQSMVQSQQSQQPQQPQQLQQLQQPQQPQQLQQLQLQQLQQPQLATGLGFAPAGQAYPAQAPAPNVPFTRSLRQPPREKFGQRADPEQVSTIANDHFKYENLDPSQKAVRFLRLEPGVGDSPLRCTLYHGTLEDGSRAPNYECLSYCWGNLNERSHIKLRYEPTIPAFADFVVSRNLEKALRALRLPNKARPIWVDAVCINQSDLAERARQVPLMQWIYSKATSVCVWIGEQNEYLEHAISTIRDISTHFEKDTNIPASDIIGPKGFNISSAQLKTLESYGPEKFSSPSDFYYALKTLGIFFNQPYFRRSWVLQEVVKAQTAMVYCGSSKVHWNQLVLISLWQSFRATEYLSGPLRAEASRHAGYLPEVWLALAYCGSERSLDIIELLFRARELHATDSRDKIFAVLGIAKETQNLTTIPPQIRPDYTKTKAQVYCDLARYIISSTSSLDILSAVDTFTLNGPRSGFPSWMPNFDTAVPAVRLFGYPRIYSCSPLPATLEHSSNDTNSGILSLPGYWTDTIREVTPEAFHVDSHFNIALWSGDFASLKYLWGCLTGPQSSLNVTGYPNIFALFEAFVLTLTSVGFASGQNTFPVNPLGKTLPSKERQTLFPDFVAYWARMDPYLNSFPAPLRSKLAPLQKSGTAEWFGLLAGKAVHERKFCITERGLMGLCPQRAVAGDSIYILQGGSVPYILRPKSASVPNGRVKVEFVGECYIHGFMDGNVGKELEKRGPPQIVDII